MIYASYVKSMFIEKDIKINKNKNKQTHILWYGTHCIEIKKWYIRVGKVRYNNKQNLMNEY